MILGQRITEIRKQKRLSQSALGKSVGTSGDVIGRYERGDIKPSIEVVLKIAEVLEVSVDYLVGNTSLELDKSLLKRIEDLSKMPDEEKVSLFKVIDAYIRDFKAKESFGLGASS
ncbi:MAG: helix-turn-helix transcriptional regulator [Bacteroidota bacterium]